MCHKIKMKETSTNQSILTIVYGCDHLFRWNHRIDLLLMITNFIVLNLPLTLFVGKRLKYFIYRKRKCQGSSSNNNNNDTPGKVVNVKYILTDHYKTRKKKFPEDLGNVHPETASFIANQDLSDSEEDYESEEIFDNYKTETNSKTQQDKSLSIGMREIITQSFYLILFVSYLVYLLELLILRIEIRSKYLLNYQWKFTDLITGEFMSVIMIMLVHLFPYGIFYGKFLWLKDSSRFDSWWPPLNTFNLIILHSVAFLYFTSNIIGHCIKLSIMVMLLKNQHLGKVIVLLRTYVLAMIIMFQSYFAFKHLLQLVGISRKLIQYKRIHTGGCSAWTKSFPESKIKYQRNCSTFLSMITFFWFIPILKLGYRKNLSFNDLGSLSREEKSIVQFKRFWKHYKSIDIDQYQSTFLWRVGWRTYRKSLLFGAVIKIFSDLSSLIGPISIGYILKFIDESQKFEINSTMSNLSGSVRWKAFFATDQNSFGLDYLSLNEFFHNAYVMAIVVLLATFLQSTLSNNFNHLVISEGIHLKTALNCCIYRKSLKMPVNNGSSMDSGTISNHLAIDSTNIFQFFTMMHYLWAVPIKLIILMFLLYKQMGLSAIFGASVFFTLSPFQYYCSRQIAKLQTKQMDESDKRVGKITELFMGIKLLKLMGWELPFAEQIKKYRAKELDFLRKDAIFVAINTFITQASAILVTMLTFCLYTYIENKPLEASTVFTSIALFNQITVPLYIVPVVIPMLISAIVSHRRLVAFFRITEIDTGIIKWEKNYIPKCTASAPNYAPIFNDSGKRKIDRSLSALITRPSSEDDIQNLCCFIKNGCFAWYDSPAKEYTCCGINLYIPKGKLTVLVGSNGSGKSTILASLIGETKLREGELHWLKENEKCFGYVPSTPWILNVSLRENITFGQKFEQERYQKVIQACCLKADIDLLPEGDQTFIGERGLNLSGGQRQRVALARALYSSSKTLILDDSLSALDPIVGYSVFENAIMRLAIKQQNQTVILATHKQEYLSRCHYVVLMESGTIKNQGTLQQVQKADKAFFYHQKVLKEKETIDRLGQKPTECKTVRERKKILRERSKKSEFRGPKNKCSLIPSRPKKCLSRQVSCDTPLEPLLACLDQPEFDDPTNDSDAVFTSAMRSKDQCRPKLERLASTGSYNFEPRKRSSSVNLSLNEMPNRLSPSKIPEPNNQPSFDSKTFRRQKSNQSSRFDWTIPEECCANNDEDDLGDGECSGNNRPESNNLLGDVSYPATNHNDDHGDEEEDDDSKIEDGHMNKISEEMNDEIMMMNSQLDAVTVYNLDIDPRKNHIPFNIFMEYIKAHTYHRAIIAFLLIILNQTFRVASDFWLANWTDQDEHQIDESTKRIVPYDVSINYYINDYIILSIISVLISLLTNVYAQIITIQAVRQLHDNLLHTLVRCPLRFFDKTPIGRIVNRFTNDIHVIDKKLPIAIPVLLRFLFLCLSAIVVNIIICPYFIIAILPILLVYYHLQKIFRCTLRQLQRLESSTQSPIISYFNQTIDGLTTIRAFREEKMFTKKFHQYLDQNNICFLMVNSANCFLGIMLDYLGGVILFIAMMISITAALYWNVHRAFVGLAMTYTLLVPVYLNWLVRNITQVEMNLNSVERIYKYSMLEIEPNCDNTLKELNAKVPKSWPSNGELEFKKVTIRYGANVEPIIYDANFHVNHGQKIGICGRTGSGKSSLIGAIFRINQISKGTILIDGCDITHICPSRVRKRLAIIPQDLVLFAGSVRDNLDPSEEYTDQQLWDVLKNFHLDKTIKNLYEEVDIDSSSGIEQRLSSGEKQLLCCARAFLRDSPILIMDESTSLLDKRSEKIVLEQILDSSKTVIVVAHRVSNLAKFDRIAVVHYGHIVEFDSPGRLLDNKDSLFYSLYHKNEAYRK